MIDILSYAFMQRAIAAGVLIALACSILGVFLLLKKTAFIGEGLAHISFAGIAVGLVIGINPLLSSLALTVIAAIAIIKLKENSRLHADTIIGLLSYTGLALGIFIISLSTGFRPDIFSFLFGNILTISPFDMAFSAGLSFIVIVFIMLFLNELAFMAFDEETAKASGINVRLLNYLLAVLVAVTVAVAMRVVGILLAASFMIIPAASALQLSKGFRETIFFSAAFGVFSVLVGLIIAYIYDVAAGATIVLSNFTIFIAIFSFTKIAKR